MACLQKIRCSNGTSYPSYAGEDQSERERENDQCGRCEQRSGNTQVHRTEIVNYTVEIQTVHLLARHAGAAVGDELLESVAF